jgi:hypothetical protein
MRTLESLRNTYDHQMRTRRWFGGQRVSLHDRRKRKHSEPRFSDDDIMLDYKGPLVVCLRHRCRDAPEQCTVRCSVNHQQLPPAFQNYLVWQPQNGSTNRSQTTENDDAVVPTQTFLDADAAELPLLGAIAGVLVPQVEVYDQATHAIVEVSNEAALAICAQAATNNGDCVPAIYHRFTVIAPSLEKCEWCVYVLQSDKAEPVKNGYVGVTPFHEREQRLAAHNGTAPHGAKATRTGRPWRKVRELRGLVTRLEAETVEAQIHRALPDGHGPLGPIANCIALLEQHQNSRSHQQ